MLSTGSALRGVVGVALLMRLSVAQATPVVVKVVGPEGRPIAKAQLVIENYAARHRLIRQTDGKGQFALDLQPLADKQLGAVVAYAQKFTLARAEFKPGINLIRLERAQLLHGSVKDDQGKPISGARVRLRDLVVPLGKKDTLSFAVPEPLQGVFTTKTKADGSWTVGGVPAEGAVVMALDDPRYVYTTLDVKLKPQADIEAPPITARPGAIIAGRVLDEAGKPVAGAKAFTVVIESQHCWERQQAAITDAAGAYRITGLTTSSCTVMVSDPAPARARVAAALQKVQAREGQITTVKDFRLIKGACLEGVVVDAAHGTPLADVMVEVCGPHRPRGSGSVDTETDKTGHYKLYVAPGQNRLYVSGARGYLPRNLDVTVTGSQTKSVPVALSHGVSLAGTTVDEKGKPMAGIFLFIYVRSAQYGPDKNGSPPHGVTSDSKGNWRTTDLAPGDATIAPEAGWELVLPPHPLDDPSLHFKLPTDKPIQVIVRKSRWAGHLASP